MNESGKIPVIEAAQRLGVSRQRVLQRLNEGSLTGHKVGSQWLVEAASLTAPRPTRALSPRMAWSLIAALRGDSARGRLSDSERRRTHQRVERLQSTPPADLMTVLNSWLKATADVLELEAHPSDLPDIRKDERLVLTGISDPRAELSAANDLEAYIARDDLEAFAQDHFLDPHARPERPNLTLRVMTDRLLIQMLDDTVPDEHDQRLAPLPLTIANLAGRTGAREKRAAQELTWQLLRS